MSAVDGSSRRFDARPFYGEDAPRDPVGTDPLYWIRGFFPHLLLLRVDTFTALETQITALDADNSRRRANSSDGWITGGP
jgi:hypothetical protein